MRNLGRLFLLRSLGAVGQGLETLLVESIQLQISVVHAKARRYLYQRVLLMYLKTIG